LLDDGDMDQMFPTVFAFQDLGFDVIESDGYEDVAGMFFRIDIRLDVGSKQVWICGVHGDFADAHGNLGSGGGFLKDSLYLLRIAEAQFLGSVDDELRSGRGRKPVCAYIGNLAVAEGRRGVWIFPAIVVPGGYVLTENN